MNDKSLPFRGTQIKFNQVASGAKYAAVTITSANPPVLTITGSDLVTGDVIHIKNASEPAANGYFMLQKTAADTYTLPNMDFSDLVAIKNAQYAKTTEMGFCVATSLDITPATVEYSDVSTNCDDYPQEEGEIGAGEGSAEVFWKPDNPVMRFFKESLKNQETYYMRDKPKDTVIYVNLPLSKINTI